MAEPAALDVLYEDNHCLAVAKPAGTPSAHFDGSVETLDRLAKAYLKEKYQKPGNVFLGIVHRLDKPTSGVLLFARTSKAAARLSEQFRAGGVEKVYWAVVEARPLSPPAPREPPDMTDDERLIALRDLIQEDVGRRGLRTVPGDNLITACEGDFAAACRGLASAEAPRVAVVTGFTIAGARPPCAETDGPRGPLFLS